MNDKKRMVLNVFVAIGFKLVILILGLISTKFVINNLGKDINGLLALFTSIIGFLSIAELGVGNAITYSMYEPILKNDQDKISALYHLYKKVYFIIMTAILIIGFIISFIVPYLAKDYGSTYNIQLTYILFLISIVLSYSFAHKTSTINAFKDNYITTLTHSSMRVLEMIIQIVVLIVTKNFILFLLVRILIVIFDFIITSIIFKVKYSSFINDNKLIEPEDKKTIIKNIKALFMIHVGAVFILSTDNIIISSFIGVSMLGQYNLYTSIIIAMAGIISLVFIEITSILGHKNVDALPSVRKSNFEVVHSVNYILGVVFFLGFYAVASDTVKLIFGDGLELSSILIMMITLTFFTDFIRRSVAIYKNSMGLFHQERFRPIIEGISNIILSLILVNFMGIFGILLATILARLFVLWIIEPYVVYKYGFNMKPNKFYFYQYSIFLLMVISIFILNLISIDTGVTIKNILYNGSISLLYSSSVILITYITIPVFRRSINKLIKNIKSKF